MVGRPPIFKTPDELQKKVDEYFEYIEGEYHWDSDSDDEGNPIDKKVWDRMPEPPTITGLCLFLGFESRQSFYDYEKKTEFSYAIKKAHLRIEAGYERSLHFSKSPAGPIFVLKNLGWADRSVVEQKTQNIEMPKVEWNFIDASKK